jgi:hypothetical protein
VVDPRCVYGIVGLGGRIVIGVLGRRRNCGLRSKNSGREVSIHERIIDTRTTVIRCNVLQIRPICGTVMASLDRSEEPTETPTTGIYYYRTRVVSLMFNCRFCFSFRYHYLLAQACRQPVRQESNRLRFWRRAFLPRSMIRGTSLARSRRTHSSVSLFQVNHEFRCSQVQSDIRR